MVSDGFGFYVDDVCAPLGLEVLTNAVDFDRRELLLPPRGPVLPVLVVRRVQAGADQGRPHRGPHDRARRRRRERPQGRAARRRRVRQGAAGRWCAAVRRRLPSPFDTLADVHEALLGVKVAFGSDERTPLTDAVRADLEARGHEVVAVGPLAERRRRRARSSGPRSATTVGELVASGAADTGVLFCWTGTGASIAANKVHGVRAALCTDAATAAGARRWNDANVLVMGLRLTSPEVAGEMLDAWFASQPDADEAANIARLDPGVRARVRRCSGGAALREADEVAARVVDEGHPLLLARTRRTCRRRRGGRAPAGGRPRRPLPRSAAHVASRSSTA